MSERRDRAWINNNNIMKYADDVLTGLRVDGSVCLPACLLVLISKLLLCTLCASFSRVRVLVLLELCSQGASKCICIFMRK